MFLSKTADIYSEMSSNFNYNFGSVVEEIFELGYTYPEFQPPPPPLAKREEEEAAEIQTRVY